jgi:hypothetical protein
MKEVMDKYSVKALNGVPRFEVPRDDYGQQSLFTEDLPPIELAEDLLRVFARETLTLEEIMKRHSPGKLYVPRNYRAALWYLIDEHKVSTDPPAGQMGTRKGMRIWPKRTRVSFPPR